MSHPLKTTLTTIMILIAILTLAGAIFGVVKLKTVNNDLDSTEGTAVAMAYGTGETTHALYGQVLVYAFEVDGEVYKIAGNVKYVKSDLPSVEWMKDQTAEVRYLISEPNQAKVFESEKSAEVN